MLSVLDLFAAVSFPAIDPVAFSIGPLAVEAGIFAFLLLVVVSSAIAELHGRDVANRLVRYGFIPLIVAIALTVLVLQLPTDPGMYEPAKEAFPIVLGQGWRLMGAGIIAYGVSVTLNIWIFDRLRGQGDGESTAGLMVRGAIASALSQAVDSVIFITLAFYGEFDITDLMIGQVLAKVFLSLVLVPFLITFGVRAARWLDARAG